jgi:hypothetical protein
MENQIILERTFAVNSRGRGEPVNTTMISAQCVLTPAWDGRCLHYNYRIRMMRAGCSQKNQRGTGETVPILKKIVFAAKPIDKATKKLSSTQSRSSLCKNNRQRRKNGRFSHEKIISGSKQFVSVALSIGSDIKKSAKLRRRLSNPQINPFCDEHNLLSVVADFFDTMPIAFVALPIFLTLGRFHSCRDDCLLRRDNIFGTKTLFS